MTSGAVARAELFGTSPKKGRGLAAATIQLRKAMYSIAEAANPMTGRAIGYQLFTRGLIESMSTRSMKRVYRVLKDAREDGTIPWSWIVDEGRDLERVASWRDPAEYVRVVQRSYRRDAWAEQPHRVEVWSEKGTVRGTVQPVLEEFGVGFRVMHGFGSATSVHDVAQDDEGRPLIVLYVGDFDPSGLFMSEHDLPDRLEKYGGDHITLRRVALLPEDLDELPSFPAADKRKDSRFAWYSRYFGADCWELDALDPNTLRTRIENAIKEEIEPDAWARCHRAQAAEIGSLQTLLDAWVA